MQEVKVRCLYDNIITTANKRDGSIVLSTKDELLSRQTVLVAGPTAVVVPGDEIEINTDMFKRRFIEPKNGIGPDKQQIIVPIEEIDGVQCLWLSTREIKYVYVKDDNNFVSTQS